MNLYQSLGALNKIKRKEIVLPIAKKEVVVTPLSVGDDIALKTAIISPVRLDAEIMKLLWTHTDFWKSEEEVNNEKIKVNTLAAKEDLLKTGGVYYKPKEQDFYKSISYFDKLVLIWAIYLITYGTLGKREIECDNEECKCKFTTDIDLEDTLHNDSLTLFDQDVPFNEYTVPITIDYSGGYILEFETRIPSMADYNRLMRLVPVSDLQNNLEKIGNQFSMEQLITLYTSKMSLYKKESPDVREETTNMQEILACLRDNVNLNAAEAFIREYVQIFSKYSVKFYKECECPNCHKTLNVGVDVELELFRKQLPNRG